MIGKLRNIVLDTREPRRLADFYAALVGGEVTEDDGAWVVVVDGEGRRLAFQLAPDHTPPRFPDPAGSQQVHIDLHVEDIDAAEREVLALGATRVTEPHEETDFRVFLDPAGHPFCLIFNID
ncbi:VOC family protein [Actinokineospora iranica]|uniref:VOC domain-containing protein n=1 Tax=Actinokineospora iranica TaxID=1271860 RepID=A0A1G6U7Y9_9PSEU|nr:VOC family protein [Actinokineospora iranica]SDD37512.1 hypothetical protein SAMN05216174_110156 [Actinokineospora iranica]